MREVMRRTASTVYPTRTGAFPAATFFTTEAELAYIRTVQADYHGTFGICVCTADSFWMHQADVRPAEAADGNPAREAGDTAKADECYAKAQYWLDRANLLSGRSDRPAPKQ